MFIPTIGTRCIAKALGELNVIYIISAAKKMITAIFVIFFAAFCDDHGIVSIKLQLIPELRFGLFTATFVTEIIRGTPGHLHIFLRLRPGLRKFRLILFMCTGYRKFPRKN